MAGVYGILSTWKKKTGKSWAAEIPAAHQCCVALLVCRSALSPGSLCGMCCGAGSKSLRPSCGSLTRPQPPLLAPAHPETHMAHSHTQQLSPWSHCPSAEEERVWLSFFFSNKPTFHCYRCAPEPPLSGSTESGLAASLGAASRATPAVPQLLQRVAQNFL